MTEYRAELEAIGAVALMAGHDQGLYEMPTRYVNSFKAIQATTTRDAATATNFRTLSTMTSGGGPNGASGLITDVLQPALARHLDTFAADVAVLGPYAEMSGLTGPQAMDILGAGGDIAAAYVRHQQTDSWYGTLRTAWKFLRQREMWTPADPDGVDGVLAEVANAPDVLGENWRHLGRWSTRGFVPTPWSGTAAHLRLGWLVRNGAVVWMPTSMEHNEAWHRLASGAAGTDPRTVNHEVERPTPVPVPVPSRPGHARYEYP